MLKLPNSCRVRRELHCMLSHCFVVLICHPIGISVSMGEWSIMPIGSGSRPTACLAIHAWLPLLLKLSVVYYTMIVHTQNMPDITKFLHHRELLDPILPSVKWFAVQWRRLLRLLESTFWRSLGYWVKCGQNTAVPIFNIESLQTLGKLNSEGLAYFVIIKVRATKS